jgi:hypothetical protein
MNILFIVLCCMVMHSAYGSQAIMHKYPQDKTIVALRILLQASIHAPKNIYRIAKWFPNR